MSLLGTPVALVNPRKLFDLRTINLTSLSCIIYLLSMTQPETRLLDYLQSITGDRPDLQKLPSDRVAALPLFLRERYHFQATRLFGRKCLLALETPEWETGSPAEYGSHSETLKSKLGEDVIIVVPAIASYSRNRMVRAGVPFIVPGNQMFLPSMMVDLREHFSASKPAAGKPLAPATQCIILCHLLRKPLDTLSLREIATETGYTAMMITKVKDELEAAELCEPVRQGRTTMLKFVATGKALWNRAEPKLSTPVKKSHWVRWAKPSYPALAAGLTALSRRTMIEDDRLPTYALPDVTFRAHLEKGIFHGCPDASEATISLQVWTYTPNLLGDDHAVDPLSLYLSLRHSADERVQQQLKRLIDEVPW